MCGMWHAGALDAHDPAIDFVAVGAYASGRKRTVRCKTPIWHGPWLRGHSDIDSSQIRGRAQFLMLPGPPTSVR
jgi:hypothetical protein